MGLEFRDTSYTIGAKCLRTIKSNMIFSVTLGFNNIPDTKSKDGDATCVFFTPSSILLGSVAYVFDVSWTRYALSLIDTVKVGKSGSVILSEGMKSKDEVMFYMEVCRSLFPRPCLSTDTFSIPCRMRRSPRNRPKRRTRNPRLARAR